MTELTLTAQEDNRIEFLDEEFDFEERVTESLEKIKELNIVEGTVTKITKDFVTVDFGYKSEGQIPTQEFFDSDGALTVEVQETTEIYLERFEDEHGQVVVSKEKAKKNFEFGKMLARFTAKTVSFPV